MTLLKDLIHIPERVHKGDFVLRLAEGVSGDHARATLHDYVPTEQLVACFDKALGLIGSALEPPCSSKAAYLHGSFGAGKSHFMAVLHLLLQHHPEARAVPELHALLEKHRPRIEGKRFLLVPYHMIGAESMESAVLAGYAAHVAKLHPDAPLPAIFLSADLLEDAAAARRSMGDAEFFRRLNEGKAASADEEGWGDLAGSQWTDRTYGQAVSAPPGSQLRGELVADLVRTHFPAYRKLAAARGELLVPLDDGLAAMSKHARSLGYDALILFLDELILWLASRMADQAFVTREGQKVAKLVEAASSDRPVPIVSFVARQRDLRELVGEHVPGAEQLTFADVLKWWHGRFDVITLEDRNLPAIAERRVLRTITPTAREEIDRAFEQTARVRDEVMDVLLTSQSDRRLFRQLYPFSPAFVQTLVAVSSALQRERTALKMLVLYLSQRRDDLELGHVVPVGDLFDLMSEGDEPFSAALAEHFQNARKLFLAKLVPLLERDHGVGWEEVRRLPPTDAKARAFLADARLFKTLLLGALVPEVETLRGLSAGKLAALNHGTIRSPIPGREAQIVLQKVKRWGASVGEIKLSGDEANPTISIQVSGIDTDQILRDARGHFDNDTNRKRALRDLVYRRLGLVSREGAPLEEALVTRTVVWRGTERPVEVLFENVRKLPFTSLRARDGSWKVVIDYPFDEDGGTALDDLAHAHAFRDQERESRTICWLPTFLSAREQKDLGTMVVIDHLLRGDRFNHYASHLAPVERHTARVQLENQLSQLRLHLTQVLDAAYGILATAPEGALDLAHAPPEPVVSLDEAFTPQRPVGADLGQAFRHLVDQALSHQFPAHPDFSTRDDPDDSIRPGQVRKVLEELLACIQRGEDSREPVPQPLRSLMRRVAQPLELGTMHEAHFELGRRWPQHLDRCHARDGGELSVGRLRKWLDEPRPRGLLPWSQDLVILAFAAQTQRSFRRHDGPYATSGIGDLPDDLVLQDQALPSETDWTAACERAQAVFGFTPSRLRNAANVGRLEADLIARARDLRPATTDLVTRLQAALRDGAVDAAASRRLATALTARQLVDAIHDAADGRRVAVFARTPAGAATPQVLGRSLATARAVADALAAVRWAVVHAALGVQDAARADDAGRLRAKLRDALVDDEWNRPLAEALRGVEGEAAALLARGAPTAPPRPEPPRPEGTRPEPPRVAQPAPEPDGATRGSAPSSSAGTPPRPQVSDRGERSGMSAAEARDLLERLLASLAGAQDVRVHLSWTIEPPGARR